MERLVQNTASISACIVCRNEVDRLAVCLESLAWVDEIIVMDLQSSDGSAQIAESHNVRVVSRTPHPFVEPLRNEFSTLARSEWILVIDPDEQVTPGLAQELRRLAHSPKFDAIVIPRTNWDLGYPPSNPIHRYEPQLRMYRRAAVVWPATIHMLPSVPEARKYRIPAQDAFVLIHYRSRTILEVLDRVTRYTPAQAQAMIDQGQEFSAYAMVNALLAQIDKEFFRAEAWKDGVPGVLRAALLVGYKFYIWAAFWQLSGGHRTIADDRFIRRVGMVAATLRQVLHYAGVMARLARRVFRHRSTS